MPKIFAFFCLLTLISLGTKQASAIPPEGLEAFGLLGQSPGSQNTDLYVQAGYVNPSWLGDYETLQSYISWPTSNGDEWTAGGELTVGNPFAARDIYFIRHDFVFWGQNSISLKFAHEDLSFLQSGKNTFSADYNVGFSIAAPVAFYLALGVYYRFNLNSWDQPAWSPINYNTDDRDSFLEVCFGSKITLSDNFYLTADINNRDPFLAYNGDDLAFDITANLISSDTWTWRLIASTRFSGLLVGTADVGEEKFLLGMIAGF